MTATQEVAPARSEEDGAALELVVQRVRMRLGLRLAWLTHLRGLGLGDVDIATGDRDRLDDELAWREEAVPPELLAALAATQEALRGGAPGRLGVLAEVFGLAAPELDLVHVCLAADEDERVGRVLALAAGDDQGRRVTEAAAARLCDRRTTVLATSESPLRLWGIVVDAPGPPGDAPSVALDPTIAAWLHGVSELDPRLVGVVRGTTARGLLETWPVDEVVERCRPRPGQDQPDPTRIVVRGRSGSGRRSFAAAVCAELGLQSAEVDSDRIPPELWPATFVAVQRHAYLERCAPVWHGRQAAEAGWPALTPHFPVQVVCIGPDGRVGEVAELADVVVELPEPSVRDRRRLWGTYVPESETWPEPERSDVVERPHTTVGDIVHVAGQRVSTAATAREALRRRNRERLGPLVAPMPLPYRRDDLVVPDRVREGIDFLLFEARERRLFWADGGRARLYPQAGLVALLAGPPGVGKTMTAQVVAAELGVDLLRVNLAETISKYVGETAKNLDAVLRNARDLDAVLLCDEADTLFGRRTEIRDAHDRWANADTNFLLQAIETYPGVAILATNRKDQLDDALTRRLRHVLELPRPDAAGRLALWRTLLADVAPGIDLDPLADLLERLATRLELTGAEIKNAVLNAAFVAARAGSPVDADAVVDGLDRELGKQGRSLSVLDRRRIHDG